MSKNNVRRYIRSDDKAFTFQHVMLAGANVEGAEGDTWSRADGPYHQFGPTYIGREGEKALKVERSMKEGKGMSNGARKRAKEARRLERVEVAKARDLVNSLPVVAAPAPVDKPSRLVFMREGRAVQHGPRPSGYNAKSKRVVRKSARDNWSA